ncbi:hypothetical protein ACLIA0_10815 [Bacillaceae bacterium W0354]
MTILKQISSKYAAAFFAMFTLMIGYFFISGMSVSDTYDMISSPIAWAVFGIYLIVASLVIDRLIKRFQDNKWYYVSAYTLAGSFFWFIVFFPILFESLIGYFYFVLYGSIFTVFPFIIFFGVDRVIRQSWKRIGIIGLTSLIVLLFVLIVNPSIKKGFESEYGDDNYVAQFENFNGQETIEIPVEAGSIYIIDIDWKIKNDASYGMRISRNVHELGEFREVEGWTYQYHAEADGIIELTYHGNNIKGKIEVSWDEVVK